MEHWMYQPRIQDGTRGIELHRCKFMVHFPNTSAVGRQISFIWVLPAECLKENIAAEY
jgi:hypothetical protein